MQFEDWVAALQSLTADDFDYLDLRMTPEDIRGRERLYELTDAVEEMQHPDKCVSALFQLMERLPESDLGSPGPIVHTLETLDYEDELEASILRQPTPLSVWMLNRILNPEQNPARRERFMALLRFAQKSEVSSDDTRREATEFLQWQAQKDA